MTGKLYLCATPIGNLGDVSARFLEVFRTVDLIACEDTRQTVKLLNYFNIQKPMTSYHEHNKREKGEYIVNLLKEGKNVALVSDAGTPAISDPGEDLVRACHEAGISVTSLPGASAVITALTLSGMKARRFTFEGFLPTDKKERAFVLQRLADTVCTTILYEAPHRIRKTLLLLEQTIGADRQLAICKELTKKHETVLSLTVGEARAYFEQTEPKGEFVIVIEGANEKEQKEKQQKKWQEMPLEEHMNLYLQQGMDKKESMKAVAKDRGVSKREIYSALLE